MEANYFTILWWILPYIDMNQPLVNICPPVLKPCSLPSPFHPSGLSQHTSFESPVSCIKHGLVICFTYGNIHASMLFSEIIPPLPSPTEFKSLFFISVFLLLSHIYGHCYNLSKFYIYLLLLLLSRFSHVRLCATHRQQPTRLCRPWGSPGKNTGVYVLNYCRAFFFLTYFTLYNRLQFHPPH